MPKPSPRLPPELLHMVLSSIDLATDRATLASLVRVSHAFWEISAPYLYRYVEVDEAQLHRLIAGNLDPKFWRPKSSWSYLKTLRHRNLRQERKLSARAERAFALVECLHLHSPPLNKGIEELWFVTQSNVPLFPNARQLCLEDKCVCADYKGEGPLHIYASAHCPRHSRLKWDMAPNAELPTDVVLFDKPLDLCVRGPFSHRRMDLFTNAARDVAWHIQHMRGILSSRTSHPPGAWESFSVHEPDAPSIQFRWPTGTDKKRLRRATNKLVILLNKGQAKASFGKGFFGEFDLVPEDNCPPCAVCGANSMATQSVSLMVQETDGSSLVSQLAPRGHVTEDAQMQATPYRHLIRFGYGPLVHCWTGSSVSLRLIDEGQEPCRQDTGASLPHCVLRRPTVESIRCRYSDQ